MRKNSLLFIALLWICCSNNNISDGGSGSEAGNGIIVGDIVYSDGAMGQGAYVSLIPRYYNPVIDPPLPDSFIVNADMNGHYQFELNDSNLYNIQISDQFSSKSSLRGGVAVKKGDTVSYTDTLLYGGTVNCVFYDTITPGGTVYVEGTDIQKPISEGVQLSGGYYCVQLDSVPVGALPAVKYLSQGQSVLVTDTAMVISLDTIIVGVVDTLVKPLWRFSCIVGVTGTTVQMFGGPDSIKVLIEDQISQTLNKFNDPGLLNGELGFSIDSIYQFDSGLNAEINKTLSGFDYRFIYYADTDDLIGSYTTASRTVCQVDRGQGLFSQFSVDALAWSIGMARGVVGLEWLVVRGENNPVNSQDYAGIKSFMNWPYGENTLDEYTKTIVNYYADSVFYGPNLVNWAFPENITITVRDSLGLPMSYVPVSLYGVGRKTFAVDTPAVIEEFTDGNGTLILSSNPFNPDNDHKADYLNFLVTSYDRNETAYTWLPVTDVVSCWLSDPDGVCRVTVQFKGD